MINNDTHIMTFIFIVFISTKNKGLWLNLGGYHSKYVQVHKQIHHNIHIYATIIGCVPAKTFSQGDLFINSNFPLIFLIVEK